MMFMLQFIRFYEISLILGGTETRQLVSICYNYRFIYKRLSNLFNFIHFVRYQTR